MAVPDHPILALVFDLDGTLVDSRRDLADAVNRTRRDLGLEPLPTTAIVPMIGDGARMLMQRGLGSDCPAGELDRAVDLFLDHYGRVCLRRTRPYPGVPEMLAALAARYRLAVLTNKPESLSRRILRGLALDGFFASVVGGDSLTSRKPDPAGLLLIARRLEVAVERCLLVGDSRIDASTARAARCSFAFCTWGFSPPESIQRGEGVMRVTSAWELLRELGC